MRLRAIYGCPESDSGTGIRPASSTEPCSQSVSSPVRNPPIPRSAQNLELDGSLVNGSFRAFLHCFEDLRDRVIGSHLAIR